MTKKRMICCMLAACALSGALPVSGMQLKQATAISEVFGDGAKITTVLLTYDEKVDGLRLTPGSFKVKGREVVRIYATDREEKGQAQPSGHRVVIELKTQTELQAVNPDEGKKVIQGPVAGQVGMPGRRGKTEKPLGRDSVVVTQVSPLYAVGGKEATQSKDSIIARSTRTLIADDFSQYVFDDKETGIRLKYNLYSPKYIEPGKHYPLVVFIHDAGGAGRDVKNTLLQGNGATVWASPQWQADHPCFVLAPQFGTVTVDDDFHTTPDLDAFLRLMDKVLGEYPVDRDRVYTTGQSMGCMSSYVLMLRRPDLFASAMLVAGQWNPAVMAPLAQKNLWLLSCKGDAKSSEGVAQAIEVWKKNGATVVEQEWPLTATPEARREEVAAMLRKGGNIHYTHFAGGSHNNTWRVAYDIEGVREWLFAQRRPLSGDSLMRLFGNAQDTSFIVVAKGGDFHGSTPHSIHAVEKALLKGAQAALIDVEEKDGCILTASGDRLDSLLSATGRHILLLLHPNSDSTAQAIERMGTGEPIVLYASSYGTQLPYMARLNLDKATMEDIRKVMKDGPAAVELDFSSDDNPLLGQALSFLCPRVRVCLNMTQPGLCGAYTDKSSREERMQSWERFKKKGASIFLSNEIKPLLYWKSGLSH